MRTTRIVLAAAFVVAAVSLASCAAATEEEPPAANAGFPASIEVPGADDPLVVESEPERIVALSPDAAIALHELGATDRLVALPEAALNPTLNAYADDLGDVPNVVSGETSPEPEQVLAWDPDLIVVTARHTGEQDASAQLSATGVPVLTLTNGWSSSDAITENLALIGEATGLTDAADALGDEIRDGVEDVRTHGEETAGEPSVAVLSNQAGPVFLNAGTSLTTELVENAGGTNVADAIGVTKTMPIQPEQLVAADPDAIMLVDVTGRGEESFDQVLGNAAVAGLDAVADGNVRMFPGREVYGLGGREVVSGSEAVLEWLQTDVAG